MAVRYAGGKAVPIKQVHAATRVEHRRDLDRTINAFAEINPDDGMYPDEQALAYQIMRDLQRLRQMMSKA